ncbi:MAG: hypothetical protein KTR13_02695 [Saprospiraceae bacterium]|nr:hypothetical protein [Saprospiraceae bacterium]
MRKLLILMACLVAMSGQAQIDTLLTSSSEPAVIADSTFVENAIRPEMNSLRSAGIPGWGQLRNEQPLKAAVFLAAVAGGIYLTADQAKEYRRYDDAYISRIIVLSDGGTPTDEFAGSLDFDQLQDQRRTELSKKDIFTGITAYSYLLNVVDAGATMKINQEDDGTHSPTKAAYYSFVLPGLGQAYNKKYWKIPLVYGALGASTYISFNNRNIHRDYREEIERRTAGFDPEFRPGLDMDRLETQLEQWREWRDLAYIATGIVYMLNVVDATVDAHLYDYSVDDDLGFKPTPTLGQTAEGYPYYAIQLSFGIGN